MKLGKDPQVSNGNGDFVLANIPDTAEIGFSQDGDMSLSSQEDGQYTITQIHCVK